MSWEACNHLGHATTRAFSQGTSEARRSFLQQLTGVAVLGQGLWTSGLSLMLPSVEDWI